jgi:hypothetical protein
LTAALLLLIASCRPGRPHGSAEIDLIRELPHAERRAAAIDQAMRLEVTGPPTDRRMALVLAPPVRITWVTRVGPHAHLRAALALVPDGTTGSGANIRIGVSDQRLYDLLFSRRLLADRGDASRWLPLDLDLSPYGGWQWSLFYRPWTTAWRINVSVNADPHGAIALERPRIEMSR